MKRFPLIRWAGRLSAALLLAALAATPVDAGGRNGNSAVVPSNARAYGMTYGEWSAAWWQWALSLPVDAHPLFDTADGSTGQSGKVWFLGGTFTFIDDEPTGTVIGTADRTVTVPAGTSLFFPILNAEGSTLEGNGSTPQELLDYAAALADTIDPRDLFLEVDGLPVTNLARDRAASPVFEFGPLPENNLLADVGGEPGATGYAASDGYYALLKPLSVGKHTLHFGGFLDFTGDAVPDFILDIKYTVTVVPARRR